MICQKCKLELADDQFDMNRRGQKKSWCRTCCKELSNKIRKYNRKHPKKLYNGRSYHSRQMGLQSIGFSSYQQYLASDLWKEVRKMVYATKGTSCYLCGSPATQLHHNRYHKNDLVGKKLKYINPVCGPCHQSIEFKEDGSKSTVLQASSAFRRTRKKFRSHSSA